VGQAGCYLLFTHFYGMTFVVKENVLFHPAKVGLFGSGAVVSESNQVTSLFKEFGNGNPNCRKHVAVQGKRKHIKSTQFCLSGKGAYCFAEIATANSC